MKPSGVLHRLYLAPSVRFVAVSALSFFVNLGLTTLLHEAYGLREEAAFGLALATVFVINFLMNRYVVYRASSGAIGQQLALFAVSSLGFRFLEYGLFLVLHTWLGVYYPVAAAGTLGLSVVAKFLWFKSVVFRASLSTSP